MRHQETGDVAETADEVTTQRLQPRRLSIAAVYLHANGRPATCTSDRCTFTRARKAMLARYKLWPLQPCVCVCYNSEVGVLSKHLDQSGQRDMVSSFDLLYTPCLRKFDHLQK